MMLKKYYLKKLQEHYKKSGAKGLLPHKLPDDLYKRLLLEYSTEDEDIINSTLLMTVVYLKAKNSFLEISDVELMEAVEKYSTLLSFEELRKTKYIDYVFPTVEEAFNPYHKIPVRVLKKIVE